MRFGFSVLRLSPEQFWSMTPRELAAAFGAPGVDAAAMPREKLEALMALFPDESLA